MPDTGAPEALLVPGDRVVMISGASRGIGAALARRLLADGYRLSLGVRRPAETRAKFADAMTARLLVSRFDALEPATAERWLSDTLEKFGRLDALINNAGIIKPLSFSEGSEEVLDDLWAVNVKAPFRLIRLALPELAKSGNGRIVNVASTDAKRYRDSTVSIAYAMTKHAVLALTHAAQSSPAGSTACASPPSAPAPSTPTSPPASPASPPPPTASPPTRWRKSSPSSSASRTTPRWPSSSSIRGWNQRSNARRECAPASPLAGEAVRGAD